MQILLTKQDILEALKLVLQQRFSSKLADLELTSGVITPLSLNCKFEEELPLTFIKKKAKSNSEPRTNKCTNETLLSPECNTKYFKILELLSNNPQGKNDTLIQALINSASPELKNKLSSNSFYQEWELKNGE